MKVKVSPKLISHKTASPMNDHVSYEALDKESKTTTWFLELIILRCDIMSNNNYWLALYSLLDLGELSSSLSSKNLFLIHHKR